MNLEYLAIFLSVLNNLSLNGAVNHFLSMADEDHDEDWTTPDLMEFQRDRFNFAGNCEFQGRFQDLVYGAEGEDAGTMVTRLRRMALREAARGRLVGNCIGGSAALIYTREYEDVEKVVSGASRLEIVRDMRQRFGEGAVRRMGR